MSFVVGLLVGLTSMGGAALMTPFLILVAGVRPVLAVGTDLVYGAVTKIVGSWMHWRQGTVDLSVALRMAIGSVPGGVLGVYGIQYLHDHGFSVDKYLRQSIGVALVLVAFMVLVKAFGYMPTEPPAWLKRYEKPFTIGWGAVIGFLVGLTSVGSGSLIAPFLIMLYPRSPSKAVGTDVFHAAILVTATGFVHSSNGNVDWHLVPILLAGSLPGVLIGSFIAPRMPARSLRIGLSVLLFATGVRLV